MNQTRYQDSLVISRAVVSNVSGTAFFPNGKSGEEGLALDHCQREPPTGGNRTTCSEVPMYSLDNYLEEHELTTNDKPVDMLLIDAEGFDYEVLQGAVETLKRVRYLSFEVHIRGNWMKHSLKQTVDTLLRDFTCYWVGKGRLWRITNCTNEDLEQLYEYKSWSNVACVHQRERQLAAIMNDVFLEKFPTNQ